ncbi:Ig-like domain-containing protein [Clostridioides sp. ES-S-0010-02]|uniref:Ig-like domain-containing protein n=1 Tax=Clostridioides sp. ES-S-0010-02 TaxID=2770776 RepID=UPI001D0F5F8F|nr:Ig-like domain-containing protein [Clostridioides sp. ES-S-0010-02]
MDLNFEIKLIIENTEINKLITFNKHIIKKNLKLYPHEELEVDSKEITKYFAKELDRYSIENNIHISKLMVDGYEIESLTEGVYIFFKTENTELFSLSPSIVAVLEEEKNVIIKENKVLSYTKFKLPERVEIVPYMNINIASRMKAFQSGIGDYNDCKLYKSEDTTYKKTFKLLNKIYGIRASNKVKYNTIKFYYRYKMEAKTNYITYDSKVSIRVSAREVSQIREKIEGEPFGPTYKSELDLDYVFDEHTQVADIYLYSLIPELKNKDYSKRYKFDIEVYNIKGPVRIYSYTHGYRDFLEDNKADDNVKFSEYGYFDHKVCIKAVEVIRQKEYIEIFPPLEYDSLVGAINGDFEVSENGKKDMVDTAPVFEASLDVYDRKYYCIIEKFSPEEAYVLYEFDNQVDEEDYTLINGDKIKFYSDSIISDSTEYKEFLGQVDRGEFIIDDNRKHTYVYGLTEFSLNSNEYKRFELVVEASISDVMILDYPKVLTIRYGYIDDIIIVSLRTLQNALARWCPSIHNGYYYYNQDEYYLYNKCNMNGQEKILQDTFNKFRILIKITLNVSEPTGQFERYDIRKFNKKDLLLDSSKFVYKDNMLWPKPIKYYNDYYYDFLEEYIYETTPFLFNKKPTSIQEISWIQKSNEFSTVDVFYVGHNDIYGEWMQPVKLIYGEPIPLNLILCKVFKLRFILKPSKMPKLQHRELIYECESDWRNFIDSFLSFNFYYREEVLMPLSDNSISISITNIIDLGDTIETTENLKYIMPSMKFDGEVEFYVQDDNVLLNLEGKLNSDKWIQVENNTKIETKRFVRFKIVLKEGAKLYSLNLKVGRYEYTGMNLETFLPSIGDIKVKATYNSTEYSSKYENIISYNLPYDTQPYTIIKNIEEYAETVAKANNFKLENIKSIKFTKVDVYSEEYNILYDGDDKVTKKPVKAQSLYLSESDFIVESEQDGIIFKVPYTKTIRMSPIPQQYSPIIIYEIGIEEPYTQVFFLSETGEYSLESEEKFESLGFKTLYLQNIDIDETTIVITINEVLMKDYTIENNVIVFEKEVPKGKIINVRYKIKNSFIALYDYEKDEVEIKLHKFEEKYPNKVKVYFETHKTSSLKELKHISLNPIYNTLYNGYIYISDYTLEPYFLRIYLETNFVFANGKDDISILISVTDVYNNPVEGAFVNIESALGTIEKLNDRTDINGIIPCIYTSWTGDCIDVIKAIANENAKDEITIVNRKI